MGQLGKTPQANASALEGKPSLLPLSVPAVVVLSLLVTDVGGLMSPLGDCSAAPARLLWAVLGWFVTPASLVCGTGNLPREDCILPVVYFGSETGFL